MGGIFCFARNLASRIVPEVAPEPAQIPEDSQIENPESAKIIEPKHIRLHKPKLKRLANVSRRSGLSKPGAALQASQRASLAGRPFYLPVRPVARVACPPCLGVGYPCRASLDLGL
jgi:hypothetical protein